MERGREGEWREGWFGDTTGPRVTGEMRLLQDSSLHRRGPPGAVKALPGAQGLAQRLAQSRCSKALWGE